MKNILFTLALLISFSSFGQLDSNGEEYHLPKPMLEFNDYPVVVNSKGIEGLSKKYLMKELKCYTIAYAGRKYLGISEVIEKDIIPIVVSFDISIAGNVTNVKGNSIKDSSIAKNLLDKAKVGDEVIFSNVKVVLEKGSKTILNLDGFYVFEITE